MIRVARGSDIIQQRKRQADQTRLRGFFTATTTWYVADLEAYPSEGRKYTLTLATVVRELFSGEDNPYFTITGLLRTNRLQEAEEVV
jgi:hypothetical protein